MLRSTKWITGTWTRDILLTAVLFVWLFQLLAPLGQAGRIPDMDGFYLLVGLFLFIDLMKPLKSLNIGLKLAAQFLFMHQYYYSAEDIWQRDWFMHVLQATWDGVSLVLQRRYMEVPEIPQTFFFIFFLWLTVSVYRNAMLSRVWLFILLFIGEVVIGVIDTFFPPDASGYVVRYFLLGFVVLSLSQLPEVEKWARIPESMRGWPVKWTLWTMVITLTAVGTGMAAPKYPPAWPDPVAFLQGKAVRDSVNGPKKIGYGTDDSALGGPYVMDDTVVFTVLTNQAGYYRGESKAFYTGKGWSWTGKNFPVGDRGQVQRVPLDQFRKQLALLPDIRSKKVEQEIQIENGQFNVLLSQYQYENVQINPDPNTQNRILFHYFNPEGWRVAADLRKGYSYIVVSQVPYYDPEGFKERSKNNGYETNPLFLQLPDTLPDRVRQLAKEITAGKTTAYEKAKAIEEYLRTNYRYEIKDVPFPAPEQDFVDQFLFESKKGYCDHFSSSMVVLARAAGLPARWVKGFTEGEQDLSSPTSSEKNKYVVRNKNAHSWPELYIPGTGWLPFEPTASFSQPVVQEAIPVATPEEETKQPKTERNNMQEEQDTSVNVSYEIDWKLIGKISLWTAVVLLVAALIFRRRLWVAFYVRRSLGKSTDESSTIVLAIERLMSALQRFGWKREPDRTVREFGTEMTVNGYKGNEWISLARIFERVRYGNKKVQKREIRELRELWERIVRKIGRTKRR